MDTQKAVEKMKSINLEYDYSKFIFKNYTTKSIIICKYHGKFEYSYNNAIRSRTKIFCKECLKEYNRLNNKFIFLENMKNKFPELDFSKFNYKNKRTSSHIRCKKHDIIFKSRYYRVMDKRTIFLCSK